MADTKQQALNVDDKETADGDIRLSWSMARTATLMQTVD
ncbi:hypothetical protein SynBIOSE41_02843 [Synechococcus sp. BIOS-E4-1]|nr:hypothetical protein SynBIOSE41_02843 [Synechococcus sp. BIOS-E4-1]